MLTIAVILASSLSIFNVNAITNANHTDFSIQIPNGWVYRENIRSDNNIILTPDDFVDKLLPENVYTFDVLKGTFAELAPDLTFPVKNAPLDMYVKHALRYASGLR